MKPLIAIVGPTASGKTSLSIALAKALDTQIICMDSMQVYRQMDIGTAKPTMEERAGITHHMLDVADPRDAYSVAEYVRGAKACIDSLHHADHIPILVGGTGLYLKALSGGMTLGGTVGNDEIRRELEAIAETEEGKRRLHRELERIDPKTAARLHVNDSRRVIRAIEVFRLTGKPISAQESEHQTCEYDLITLGVGVERPLLIERINKRIDIMFEQGLVGEVQSLVAGGVSPSAQSMQGLGYKELIPYLNGEATLDEVKEQLRIGTRQYAKRQMTWFRRTPAVCWLDGLAADIADQAMLEINKRLQALRKEGAQ